MAAAAIVFMFLMVPEFRRSGPIWRRPPWTKEFLIWSTTFTVVAVTFGLGISALRRGNPVERLIGAIAAGISGLLIIMLVIIMIGGRL